MTSRSCFRSRRAESSIACSRRRMRDPAERSCRCRSSSTRPRSRRAPIRPLDTPRCACSRCASIRAFRLWSMHRRRPAGSRCGSCCSPPSTTARSARFGARQDAPRDRSAHRPSVPETGRPRTHLPGVGITRGARRSASGVADTPVRTTLRGALSSTVASVATVASAELGDRSNLAPRTPCGSSERPKSKAKSYRTSRFL